MLRCAVLCCVHQSTDFVQLRHTAAVFEGAFAFSSFLEYADVASFANLICYFGC